jgi:hypothetical protein
VAQIRHDLDGSVYLHTGGPDGPVVLFAGDEVPEGYEVGAHLLATDEPEGDDNDEGSDVDESDTTDASDEPELTVEEDLPLASETAQPEPEPVKRSHKAKA